MKYVIGYFCLIAFAEASLLHEAIYKNVKMDHFRMLLATNDVNEKDGEDWTALHVAVAANKALVCELLIEAGADMEAANRAGATPLFCAVANNRVEILKLLLEKGANAYRRVGITRRSALHIAAAHNFPECFEILIRARNVDVNVTNNVGWSSLMYAANGGHVDIVLRFPLCETKLDARNSYGQSALHIAVIKGHLNVVTALLHFPVNINLRDGRNRTPLHYAAKLGHKRMLLAFLVRGGDVHLMDDEGNVPFLNAVWAPPQNEFASYTQFCRRSVDLVKAMLILRMNGAHIVPRFAYNLSGQTATDIALATKNYEAFSVIYQEIKVMASQEEARDVLPALHYEIMYGKRPNMDKIRYLISMEEPNRNDHLDRTALYFAVAGDFIEVARELVTAGWNPVSQDGAGNTPMHLARTGEMARMLLQANRDAANVCNCLGSTPLHFACEMERLEVVKVLAPVCNLHARNDRDHTALDVAALKRNIPIAKCLMEHGAGSDLKPNTATPLHWAVHEDAPEMVRFFLNAGIDANAVDKAGNTAAHFVVGITGNVDFLRMMLMVCKPDVTDNFGFTLLHIAARCPMGDVETVRFLLQMGVPVNAKTYNGKSALYFAAERGYAKRVKMLLDYGADSNIVTNCGHNVLHAAVMYGQGECAELLLEANPDLMKMKDFMGATPVDLLFTYDRENPRGKEMMKALSLTTAEISEGNLKKALHFLSPSFSRFLDVCRVPVSFQLYLVNGMKNFKYDNGFPNDPSHDTVKWYLKNDVGMFYAVASAYYPELAHLEGASDENSTLDLKRREYRRAVGNFEKHRKKTVYTKFLIFAMVETFMKRRDAFFKSTYVDFLPPELIEDVLVDVADGGRIFRKIELMANSAMLVFNDKNEMGRYNDYYGREIPRFVDGIFRPYPKYAETAKRKCQ